MMAAKPQCLGRFLSRPSHSCQSPSRGIVVEHAFLHERIVLRNQPVTRDVVDAIYFSMPLGNLMENRANPVNRSHVHDSSRQNR